MSICRWPAAERPREKLLLRGAPALSDAELLALFLGTGVAGQSAVAIARDLLGSHGGLRGVLDAEPASLVRTRGVGNAKALLLQGALELGERYLLARVQERKRMDSPTVAREFLRLRLGRRLQEVFACMFLDNQHRLLGLEELFKGTIDGASVHPREVVRAALRYNAAAVILAHNHPSGVAEPSTADVRITERLRSALGLVDVRVLDHLVVGDPEVVSLAERGLM